MSNNQQMPPTGITLTPQLSISPQQRPDNNDWTSYVGQRQMTDENGPDDLTGIVWAIGLI